MDKNVIVFVQQEFIFKMAAVASLKAVRTKNRHVVETELQKAKEYLINDDSAESKSELFKDVQKCKSLLKSYSEKLMSQVDKLSERLSESDSEYLQKILDEDCNLSFEVESCVIDLDQLCESMLSPMKENGAKDAYHDQMQKKMITQMEQSANWWNQVQQE